MKKNLILLIGILFIPISMMSMPLVNNEPSTNSSIKTSTNASNKTTSTTSKDSKDEGWIYYGEIIFDMYASKFGSVASLYVTELNNKLIYRVKFLDSYYPCYFTNNDSNSKRAYIRTSNDDRFYFDLP